MVHGHGFANVPLFQNDLITIFIIWNSKFFYTYNDCMYLFTTMNFMLTIKQFIYAYISLFSLSSAPHGLCSHIQVISLSLLPLYYPPKFLF